MKLAITLILVTNICALGQKGILDIVNPLPRVNDEIEVILSIDRKSEEPTSRKSREIIFGRIKLREMCLDTGLVIIGPFKFSLNGHSYETDKLELKISPELPSSSVDGLWVSVLDFNARHYLIIEQRISNRIIKEGGFENEITINRSNNELKFAELNENLLEDKGVSIISVHSITGKKIIDVNNSNSSFTFKNTIYTYELTPEFKGAFEVTKDLFKDLSTNTHVNEVWIKSLK